MNGTFILGVGAQKSGTSWLYRYLEQSEAFRAGFAKEYHVWDAVHVPLFADSKVRFPRTLYGTSRQRHRMQADPAVYFSYFASLLTGTGRITADITPSYCGLTTDILHRIRAGFDERGIRTKCVFLIRDPIERCKSAVRMNVNRGYTGEGFTKVHDTYLDAFVEYYTSAHAVMRTRYDVTIGTIRSVFGEDAYVGIYETMFERNSVLRLSDFLGVEPAPGFASERVFQGTGAFELPEDVEQQVFDLFAPVYAFCRKEFPETREVWLGNQVYGGKGRGQ